MAPKFQFGHLQYPKNLYDFVPCLKKTKHSYFNNLNATCYTDIMNNTILEIDTFARPKKPEKSKSEVRI